MISSQTIGMGVWQGVSIDSLKFHLLHPAGWPPLRRSYGRFRGGPPPGRAACGRLLHPWTRYDNRYSVVTHKFSDVSLCCSAVLRGDSERDETNSRSHPQLRRPVHHGLRLLRFPPKLGLPVTLESPILYALQAATPCSSRRLWVTTRRTTVNFNF
jgi:hypothetical protein